MDDPASLLRLIRPVNCVMMGFAVVVGAVIGGGRGLSLSWEMVLAFVTGFVICGSAMAVNDYYDRGIDAINEPLRPIPSGSVSPNEALTASFVLGLLGIGVAWCTGLTNSVIAVVAWMISMLYATVGKGMGLPGNVMVSSCVALPFVYGGVMVDGGLSEVSLMFAVIAFLVNMGREVTKGIVDITGDQALGVKTVAVSKGAPHAARVSAAFYISAAVVSAVPYYLGLVSIGYVPFVVLTDLGLIFASYSLVKDPSRERSRAVKGWILYLMMSGLVGFLLGNLL